MKKRNKVPRDDIKGASEKVDLRRDLKYERGEENVRQRKSCVQKPLCRKKQASGGSA